MTSLQSRDFSENVMVPQNARARSDILRALDDKMLDIQKKMIEKGYQPLWETTQIEYSPADYEETRSIAAEKSVRSMTFPPHYFVTVKGVKTLA